MDKKKPKRNSRTVKFICMVCGLGWLVFFCFVFVRSLKEVLCHTLRSFGSILKPDNKH